MVQMGLLLTVIGVIFLCAVVVATQASRVLELSDRFLEIRKDGLWLVMFYAPWCAHCKRLEPIWSHVAQALHNTNIRVGRVDCTRFTSMATEFGVAGFPTIMFLKGEATYTYKEDRTKEEIVNFAMRMSGPPVQQMTRAESMDMVKRLNSLFFVYVGEQDGLLWDTFSNVAEVFQPHSFFYAVSADIGRKHVKLKSEPCIFVYKEDRHYFFEVPDLVEGAELDLAEGSDLNTTLFDWINKERFHTFLKVTRGNFHQVLKGGKYLVLAVVEENKLQEIPTEMLEFRDMVESVIMKNRDKYHGRFQFGWVGTPDLANSIAMSILPLPNLLVVNSSTNHHHIPEDDVSQLTPEAIGMFLEQILNQSAPVYGGDTLAVRVYRTYFEARTSLAEMWYGNPVLTAVLFGLPLGFLSLICYSICCADIMDADEDDEDGSHEKKE